jgi:benzil reductase ((S)-benzoin forming)
MKKLIIITGVNKGLGNALFNIILNKKQHTIIAVSRNFNENQNKHKNTLPDVFYVKKDLSKLKNIENLNLIKYYSNKYEEIIFINNAATINPINAIGKLDEKSVLEAVQLNTITPIWITNHILRHNTTQRIKILNISSGAAKKPIVGWSIYCSTKAACEMFFETLKNQERDNEKIEIYNIDPGVMDTDMQENIRSKEEIAMPDVSVFKELHKNNQLRTVEEVAQGIIKKYNL